MIKKLKQKFVVTIMVFVTVIITAFIAFVTVIPCFEHSEQARIFLTMLADNDGIRQVPSFAPARPDNRPSGNAPPKNDKHTMFDNANIATAHFDRHGVLLHWFSDRQDLFDEEYVLSTAAQVAESNREFGIIDGQYYMLRQKSDGCLVVLMDNSMTFANQQATFFIAICAGLVVWTAFLFLSMWLVDKMIAPVQDAFFRQRQFISDAGHELKTPISVISANANVLQSEIGENKWLGYINDETRRMETLVKGLMTLAAVDGKSDKNEYCSFDLSKAVMSIILPFESLSFEKGIIMDFSVADGISFNGNEEKLKQVAGILLNNAIKYSEENGHIEVRLYRERKRIVFSVYNTGPGIKPEEISMIFERFYRADKARSRDGQSYGLGLAIAKAIVTEHGGTISATSDYGRWANFTVELYTRQ